MDTQELVRLIPLLAPLLVIQLGLMIAALDDWTRRERTRGPKWVWLVVILLGSMVGSLIYFFIGREEA